ncbi:MAG: GNAT family N-acetyltransferase [Jatrophihabitantaceae bacterium]
MVRIRDATPERWADLDALLGERGDPSRCWCQYYRSAGPYQHEARAQNRAAMRQQVTQSSVPHGVLGYDGERAVGWCAVAPRADYPRLDTMRAARGTRVEDGLWSVTCFVVRVGHRRQGLAGELLAGAVDLARRHGARIVEGYPVDAAVRPSGSSGFYPGPLSVYLRAGFVEVARPSASRAIVRLAL